MCSPDGSVVKLGEVDGDLAAYNAKVDQYNANVGTFNKCKNIVEMARKREAGAHSNIRRVFSKASEDSVDVFDSIAWATTKTASAARTMEMNRLAAVNTLERLGTQGEALERWANGALPIANPEVRGLLARSAEKAGLDNSLAKTAYQRRLADFTKYAELVPQNTRTALAAYPGKGAFDSVGAHAPIGTQAASKVLKSMPYLGGVLTIGVEGAHAFKGEQTWGKAAVNSVSQIGGGAAGSAFASALAGARYGPMGTFIVGSIGAMTGAVGVGAVADSNFADAAGKVLYEESLEKSDEELMEDFSFLPFGSAREIRDYLKGVAGG